MATYADLIRTGARRLEASGIDTPMREARLLMALASGLETAGLIGLERDEVKNSATQTRFEAFLTRREAREPFAHIAGTRSFYGLDFISDARALVPRPDSEIIVETALNLLPEDKPAHVADLGTGTGCLIGALLHTRCDLTGEAIEQDPDAASLARENFARLGLASRITLHVADWAKWTGWAGADLILSNPPYIASAEIARLEADVRLYDPLQALDGGADGLTAYRVIIALAATRMTPGAWLVFEIGYDQKQAVTALLDVVGFAQIQSARDLGGNDRVVWACKKDG